MKPEIFRSEMEKLHKLFFIEEDSVRLKEYWESLKHINDDNFKNICEYFKINFKPVQHKRFPIIGDFLDTVRKINPPNPVMEDVPYQERASIEEISLYFKIVEIIYSLIELKLDTFNKDHCLPSWDTPTGRQCMDFIEWAKRDFPPTWCKTMDHFSKGAYAAYLNDLNGNQGFFLMFLKSYHKKLSEHKREKISQIYKN